MKGLRQHGMALHYLFHELEQQVGERVGNAEAEQAARIGRWGLGAMRRQWRLGNSGRQSGMLRLFSAD